MNTKKERGTGNSTASSSNNSIANSKENVNTTKYSIQNDPNNSK